ncbi:ABC transporter substrate-binding protein [Inquilinus sp. Marseille-Q2685]|uniref:ABC transporter substrate-binding protein n=1 Tax=Inquilinus sp. Marseille-Q2685 TaxID=2866581 RepID=UPI001CE49118|nr:ABC transporter substrate-binding protein [Inquilinus sp. Marseille-Q2685]
MTLVIDRRGALALGGSLGLMALLRGHSASAADASQIVILQSEAPRSMDPADQTATYTSALLEPMYEGLTGYNDKMELVPVLATKWEGDATGTVWTFTLRQGVKFHDGEPCDADAVIASFARHMDEKRGLAASGRFRAVIGEVKATGADTIRFTLKRPYPAFLKLLAVASASIVSPKADKAGTLGRAAVGTGPYRLAEYKSGEYVLSEANADYWGEKAPTRNLKWIWTQEAAVMNMAVQTGDADIVVPLPPVFAAPIKANPELALMEGNPTAVFWVALNCKLAPLDDVRVRQALNLATDRAGLVSNLLYGFGQPATSPLSPAVFGYDKTVEGYGFDIAKAKDLLAEAGHADGIAINVAVQEPEANIAEILQGMWAQAGITLNIQRMESGVWTAAAFGKPEEKAAQGVHSVIASWSTGTFDADLQLKPLYHTDSWSPKGANLGFYSNAELDEILNKAGSSTDEAERKTLYAKAQRLIVQDAAHVLLYYPNDLAAARAEVKGAWLQPGGAIVPERATKA